MMPDCAAQKLVRFNEEFGVKFEEFDFKIPRKTPLEPDGSWPQAAHYWAEDERDAIILALACGRPLLVRGEPGTGKSQLARAAAVELKRRFLYQVIHPSIEAQDLLWRYDAIERLADAQRSQTEMKSAQGYYRSGVLWQAMNPGSVEKQDTGKAPSAAEYSPAVVLIDEIDKADADLPHTLLEVLGNRQFTTPWGEVIGSQDSEPPLILITTNDERELPLAFVRRCVVLEIRPPSTRPEFVGWLTERGHARFPKMHQEVLGAAADQVARDRSLCAADGARPGLAEYMDLLQAVDELGTTKAVQLKWLERLGRFALKKQPDRSAPVVEWDDGAER